MLKKIQYSINDFWKRLILFKNQFLAGQFEQDLRGKSKLNIGLTTIVLIQYIINMQGREMNLSVFYTLVRYIYSIVLFSIYIWILIGIAGGKSDLIKMINLSLYIHVFYVAMTSLEKYKFIYIFIYCIGHFTTITIQMNYLKNTFKCKYKRLKWILYIQVGIIIMGGMNHVLFYTSSRLYNSNKVISYELLK